MLKDNVSTPFDGLGAIGVLARGRFAHHENRLTRGVRWGPETTALLRFDRNRVLRCVSSA